MRDIIAYDTAIVNVVFKMYSEITGKLDSAIYKINIVSRGDVDSGGGDIKRPVKIPVPVYI